MSVLGRVFDRTASARTLDTEAAPARTAATGIAALLLALAAGGGAALPAHGAAVATPAGARAARVDLARLPLTFEENRGQTAREARFLARAPGLTVWVTEREAVLALRGTAAAAPEVLRLRWAGARAGVAPEGVEALASTSSYLLGDDPARWVAGVSHFGRVRCAGVYDGIDLELYGTPDRLEYDFVVAPGADPRRVEIALDGARRARLTAAGDLAVAMRHGTLVQHRPVAYQVVGGERRAVEARWELRGKRRAGFVVGAYDASLPLVIDPVLTYATYLGGSGDDRAYAVAMDAAGSVYVAGGTQSANFPTLGAPQSAFGGSEDVFVTKLNAQGTALVYSTYIGAGSNERAYAIAVDGNGKAVVTGMTMSTNYPRVNAFQNTYGGNLDAFVSKLNAAGSALEYSTYLGGGYAEYGYAVAADAAGATYVTGYTESANFPTASAFAVANAGDRDVFVSKLSPAGALAYSTYLGGSGRDEAYGIAVAATGHAFVAGYTSSSAFPVANAYRATFQGGSYDAFVTKLAPAGNALTYSTYLGGGSDDHARAIAVDGAGQAFVAGFTWSTNFPTLNPLQGSNAGARDVFVTKLVAAGNALAYSTYLGGSANDYAYGIAITAGGAAYVVGETASTGFPVVQAQQPAYGGGNSDGFLAALSVSGGALDYSTFLGGSATDVAWAVAQSGGSVVAAGETGSTNFPVAAAHDATFNGAPADAFVARLLFGEQYPYRYWIPSASRANGAGGSLWRTDLGVLNPNGERADFELVFQSSPTKTSTAFVAAGGQSILSDVVGSLGGSGSAALLVRSSLPVKVSSRTYNLNAAGAQCYPGATLGQNLDAIPDQQGLAAGESGYLTQLTENAAYRCNISVTNTGAAAGSAKVELFDGAGAKVGEYTVSLNPGQFKQETRPFFSKGGQSSMSRGYAKVTAVTGSGITAYASVIDNGTQDPTTMPLLR